MHTVAMESWCSDVVQLWFTCKYIMGGLLLVQQLQVVFWRLQLCCNRTQPLMATYPWSVIRNSKAWCPVSWILRWRSIWVSRRGGGRPLTLQTVRWIPELEASKIAWEWNGDDWHSSKTCENVWHNVWTSVRSEICEMRHLFNTHLYWHDGQWLGQKSMAQ